jgi:hypothetical protein
MVLVFAGCASNMAQSQCTDAGYTPGTPEYARCYKSTLEEGKQAAEKMEQQEAEQGGNPLPGSGSFVPLP